LWVATMHKSSLWALPPIAPGYLYSAMEKNALGRMEFFFLLVAQL